MRQSVDGVVIWEVKTGEADRVITVLSGSGVLTAYAKGSLRPNNKLTSPTAMLSYANFELYAGKNMYTVDDASARERFLTLSADAERYALAVYFCELLKNLAPVGDDTGEYLSLLLNALFLLGEGKGSMAKVKLAFELRIMAVSGYAPAVAACAECGRADAGAGFFDLQAGVWRCAVCAKKMAYAPNCGHAALLAMRHVLYEQAKRIYAFEIRGAGQRQLSGLAERFVLTQLGRTLPTLDFFKILTQDNIYE